MNASRLLLALAAAMAFAAPAMADAPYYSITDLGRGSNNVGRGCSVSSSGGYVVSCNGVLGADTSYLWSSATRTQTMLTASSTHNWATGVNDSGVVIGMTASTTAKTVDNSAYSGAIPVVWVNGTPTQLAASGRAYAINNAGIAVGSSGTFGAINQRAIIYNTNTLSNSLITATTAEGAVMTTAWNINNNGLIAGTGTVLDAASGINQNVALVYDSTAGTMTQIAASTIYMSTGVNPALTSGGVTVSDVNSSGAVVGSLGSGAKGDQTQMPFLWSAEGGLSTLALPTGWVTGYATGINDQGWVVGVGKDSGGRTGSFLDIGSASYDLSALLVNATGWNVGNNLSMTVTSIANDGTISGYASYIEGASSRNHGFALQITAVPEPSSYALMLGGLFAVGAIARRRQLRA